MSLKAEIKALIESFKIGQTYERKVNCLCRKDNEFNILQADICRLKSESIDKRIVEIQKDEFSCDKNLMCSNFINLSYFLTKKSLSYKYEFFGSLNRVFFQI